MPKYKGYTYDTMKEYLAAISATKRDRRKLLIEKDKKSRETKKMFMDRRKERRGDIKRLKYLDGLNNPKQQISIMHFGKSLEELTCWDCPQYSTKTIKGEEFDYCNDKYEVLRDIKPCGKIFQIKS